MYHLFQNKHLFLIKSLNPSVPLLSRRLKQSKGFFIPEISEVTKFEDLLNDQQFDGRFVSNFGGGSFTQVPKEGKLLFVIGPEGGFSESEVRKFENEKFNFLSLGSNVLRAETAAIAVASRVLIN